MSSVDEPINILNELQAYLSQFGVGDSLRGDGHPQGYHVPISLVSYTPNGMTPRFESAKNSPRLIKHHQSSNAPSPLASPRELVGDGGLREGLGGSGGKGRLINNNNGVRGEIINTVIMDDKDNGEKTTQFNREFFKNMDDALNSNSKNVDDGVPDNNINDDDENNNNNTSNNEQCNNNDHMNDINNGDNNNNKNSRVKNGVDNLHDELIKTVPKYGDSFETDVSLPSVSAVGKDVVKNGDKDCPDSGEKIDSGDPTVTVSNVNMEKRNGLKDEGEGEGRNLNERGVGDGLNCTNLELSELQNTPSLVNGTREGGSGVGLTAVDDEVVQVKTGNSDVDEGVSNLGPQNKEKEKTVDVSSNASSIVSGDRRVEGSGVLNPDLSSGVEKQKEGEGGGGGVSVKMGNSSGSMRKYSSGKYRGNSKGFHLDAWRSDDHSHHYEEMRENSSVRSQEDSRDYSYGFDSGSVGGDGGGSSNNVLYRDKNSSGESGGSDSVQKQKGNGSNPVRGTLSSDSGFSSPGVRKEDTANSSKGLGRKKRSLVRLNSTYSDLESALAVPELIIDALGEDAHFCDDDDSPLPDSIPRLTAFDSSTLPVRGLVGDGHHHDYEDVDLVPVNDDNNTRGAGGSSGSIDNSNSHDSSRSISDNQYGVGSPTTDSATHYPMVYRRSKNDPGDKQYKEVVRELSFVLEKRSADEQRQNIRDKLHLLDVHGGGGKRKEVAEAETLSRSSESVNVLGNKSLLMKLENHFRSRGGGNNISNDNTNSGSSTNTSSSNIIYGQGETTMESVLHENNGSDETTTEVAIGGSSSTNLDYRGDYPRVTASGKVLADNSFPLFQYQNAEAAKSINTPTTHGAYTDSSFCESANMENDNINNDINIEELYAKPIKKGVLDTYGKRVSAKLIYDHHHKHSGSDSTNPSSPDPNLSVDSTGSGGGGVGGGYSKGNYGSITKDLNFVSENNIPSVCDSVSSRDVSDRHNVLDGNFIISGVRLDNNDKHVATTTKRSGNSKLSSATFSGVDYKDKKQPYSISTSSSFVGQSGVGGTGDAYVGHSLSWARSRVDTAANFRGKVLTTSGGPGEGGDNMGNARKLQQQRRSKNHAHGSSRRESLNDTIESTTSTSSNGHMTTIGIHGAGLNRQSKIMYSEPDLTTVAGAGFGTLYGRHRDKPVSELPLPGTQLHNDSSHSLRDLSFSSSLMDETGIYFFDSNSFSSDKSFDTRQQQLVKLNIDPKNIGASNSYSNSNNNINNNDDDNTNRSLDKETYFISTRPRPSPTSGTLSPTHSIVTGPRSHSISMTTIAEHGGGDVGMTSRHAVSSSTSRTPSFRSVIDTQGQTIHDNRHVTVVRATSMRNDNNTPPSCNIKRSHTTASKNNATSSTRIWRSGSSASSSSLSSSNHHHHNNIDKNRFSSTSSSHHSSHPPAHKNTLYVVVPHNPSHAQQYTGYDVVGGSNIHNTSVPDLIVAHQQQDVITKTTTTTHASRHSKNSSKNGSPFHQEIFEGALPSASGDGLHRGEEDKPASFIIDARRMHGEPTVQVDGPQSIAKCNIDHLPDGQYKVTYIPVEVGIFTAQVKWNGKDIPGSPFHPKIVNALKVRVIGGWQHYMDSQERVHLVVGEEKQIPFDTSEAGSGHMRAEVKSPSAFIPVTVDEEQKGKSVVKFVPQEEGNHYINLYWCDHPLVNSPYLGYATSGVADPSKVILSGRGVKEGVVREEAEFIIDGSQAGPGEPDVQLIGVRAEIQVFTTPLGGGKYRCTYIPVIPGAYLLHISWNGRQLRGSPYKVNVIGASYPNRVIVNGEGLKGGLLGQNLDFRIDTRKAGPGELTAYCMGPTKVAYCELSDHHDGTYRLAVRAQEVGRHVLQIKYGGEHVQGSPFEFKVSAQPDASKVRVSGPGVEHGLLANFQSNFIVETKGAGAGQLTVRIRGPKGAFQVEMYRESHKDRTILCRYYPTVTGLYIINVRWSGVDVPGSPFHVNILDTHQELEHVLRDQGYTPNGHQTSLNNSNHHSNSSRIAYSHHHASQNHAHNTSRSSGYYAWRGDD